MTLRAVRALLVETFREWREDDAMQSGAALAYYAALALAPLLVTLLALSGLLIGEEAARIRLVEFFARWAGTQGEEVARQILRSREGGVFAGLSSGVLLIVGATGVFAQLQKALNHLWDVEPVGGLGSFLVDRLLGFAMVLVTGAFLLAGLALQAVLAALPSPGALERPLTLAGSTILFTALFAAIYRVLPDVDVAWRDVGVGAAVTAALFTAGQIPLGLYLGRSSVGSAYGAVGSLVAVLVWLYYSALVFFFGAEFTQVWARRHGRGMHPVAGAGWMRRPEVGGREASDEGGLPRAGAPAEPAGPEPPATGKNPRRERVRRGASYP